MHSASTCKLANYCFFFFLFQRKEESSRDRERVLTRKTSIMRLHLVNVCVQKPLPSLARGTDLEGSALLFGYNLVLISRLCEPELSSHTHPISSKSISMKPELALKRRHGDPKLLFSRFMLLMLDAFG